MRNCKLLLLCLLMVLVAAACGKKADPRLPMPIVPDKPSGFMTVARAEGIYLLWRAPDKNVNDTDLLDLGGFRILRAEESMGNYCPGCPKRFIELADIPYKGDRGKVPGGERLYYQDTALTFGTVYFYKMQAYSEREKNGKETKHVAVFWEHPPAAPAWLKAERQNKLLRLMWEPVTATADGEPAEGLAGYNVYRTTSRGIYEEGPINEEPVQEPLFEDVPEKIDQVYFYTVRAVRRVEETMVESAASGELEVAYMDVTPPAPPKGLTVLPRKDGVLLKWIGSFQKDLSGYNIYRRDGKSFVRLNSEPVTENSWLDATARIGARYVYAVTAVDTSAGANESPLSETATIRYILK